MKIIIINQKGGVGKTTTTVNLSYGLAGSGKKTLIIDLDPQAHSSVAFSPELPKKETVAELFNNKEVDIKKLIRPAIVEIEDGKLTTIDNLFIIPSNIHLAVCSETVLSRVHREKILDKALKQVNNEYDFVVIDCPPTLGVLTVNAIYTADMILIPTSYGKYSLDGIADLFDSIKGVKETDKFNYRILRTIKDSRAKRTNIPVEEALSKFKNNLFETIIRKNEAINQSQFYNLPVFLCDNNSTGSQDYLSLTREILEYEKNSTDN